MLSVGSIFDERYQIDAFIGSGGFGSVYKATELTLNRIVAIKMLHAWDEHEVRPDSLARFQREGQALCQLEHASILKVYRLGLDERTPFLIMEYFPGISLRQLMVENSRLNYKLVCNIAFKIANALQYSHAAGIIHRDLKPENILLLPDLANNDADIKIIDFGLCKPEIVPSAGASTLTGTGELLGSPDYMSPEQALGKRVDKRTDMYSFALILFEMITGEKALKAASIAELLLARLSAKVPRILAWNPRCGLPLLLDQIIQECSSINQEDRPDSFDEICSDLKEVLATVPDKKFDGASASAKGSVSKGKKVFVSVFVVALLAVSGLFALSIYKSVSEVPPQAAKRDFLKRISELVGKGDLNSAKVELKAIVSSSDFAKLTSTQRADFFFEMFQLFKPLSAESSVTNQCVVSYFKAKTEALSDAGLMDAETEKQVVEIYQYALNSDAQIDRKTWAQIYNQLGGINYKQVNSLASIYLLEIVTEALIRGKADPDAAVRYYYLKELSSLIIAADGRKMNSLYQRYVNRAHAATQYPGVYRFEARILGLMVKHELSVGNLEQAKIYMDQCIAIQKRLKNNENELELKTSYQVGIFDTEIAFRKKYAEKLRSEGKLKEAREQETIVKKVNEESTAMLKDVQEEEEALHATFDPMYMKGK